MSQPQTIQKLQKHSPASDSSLSHRKLILCLLLILLLASVLRLAKPGMSPPGANQDETANAWNAWCLLNTGKDQAGDPWPIFYSRCLGSNRSTLYYYTLMPFQWVGGFNIVTTRLPNMVGGVLAVFLIYVVGRRLFGTGVGLIAAALLAVNPWHLQNTRWGHEAGLCPFLVLLCLAITLKAGLPLISKEFQKPKPVWSLLAGLVFGVSCYGYPSIRLFLPAFLFLAILNNLTGWLKAFKSSGKWTVILFFSGFCVTFGPLAYKHITDAEHMSKRAKTNWVWEKTDSTDTKIDKVLKRYSPHFGPQFLFIKGDDVATQSPYKIGQFHWYMAVFMPVGLLALIWKWRSPAARLILLLVLCYPFGDLLIRFNCCHSLRSSPGLPGLILLGAVGAVFGYQFLRDQVNRFSAYVGLFIFIITAAVINVHYLYRFYTVYNDDPSIHYFYHVDLLKACEYIKPRFDDYDAVFCTTQNFNTPYMTVLLGLNYDPKRWFAEPLEFTPDRYPFNIRKPGEWDLYTRIGKIHFMFGDTFIPTLNDLRKNSQKDHVLFIVRPGQLKLNNPIYQVSRHDGKTTLELFEVDL